MCRAATCKRCGRTTWAGCGQHVEQVMRTVPATQRCTCSAEAPAPAGPSSAPRGLRKLFRR